MSFDFSSSNSFQDAVSLKPASSDVATHPLISVVTACFNPLKDGRKDLFLKSLDSVQQQIGVSLEHIIVDGASTDGTLEFLQAYNNKHHDMRILSMPDSGIYEAMNRGIALSRGKYVIFLNTDDFYHKQDGLLVSTKVLEQNDDCSFTFGPIKPQGPHTRFTHYHHPQQRLHKLFVTSVIPHPSMLYRRTALMQIGGYDQTYRIVADYDMTLRLIATGHQGFYINNCFATFVIGGLSTQAENRELDIKEKIRSVRNAHYKAFGIELSEQESEFLVVKGWYPHKYLPVFLASQKLIFSAIHGLPQDTLYQLGRHFNYLKYYLKCLFTAK